ncbi:MAG: hypothetical protein M9908_15465 [Phyllobacteriaceae bacterium]|nr:hypothetical protein [Phyllobacteriaceae bacterium]
MDFEILWNIWADGQLAELRKAIERMIERLNSQA